MIRNNNYFKIHPWKIVEDKFNEDKLNLSETIFSIGNGYIGIRGSFEEGYFDTKNSSIKGTYINGFYETHSIYYSEGAYGYAKNNQTILNITDGTCIKLYIDDEEFSMNYGKIIDYKRELLFKDGIMHRQLIWESPKGKKVSISIKRLVSLVNKNLASICYSVKPLNFSGDITIISSLDGDVKNQQKSDDPRVGSQLKGINLNIKKKLCGNKYGILVQTTKKSGLYLSCGMCNELKSSNQYTMSNNAKDYSVDCKYKIHAKKDKEIILNKYISYISSDKSDINRLISNTSDLLGDAKEKGFNNILYEQQEYLEEYWNKSDIIIEGDDSLQQGVRFNQYHLLQSVGRDGKTSIAAKGLTGEGYEGHYFWDTEIYVLPFFLYIVPDISKKLLEYRYNILETARKRAREMSHEKGALYPWRTISGEECSSYYPAGTAQYHINADIIYALKQYVDVTNDIKFLFDYGAEMVFETARSWIELGSFIPEKDNKFCINCVTGPDEYTAIVNNNFYTNSMAKFNLEYAYNIAKKLSKDYLQKYQEIKDKINLTEEEIEEWKTAYQNMYINNDKSGVIPQDDTFLEKEVWDFDNTSKEKYPLLLHYHPLVIYRHQVCKQADVVLALFLLSNQFSKQDKKINFDYYEKITTHDSSLSHCIYSIMASEIGYHKKAYNYFLQTVRLDLDNYHNNTQHGVHIACMAGSWMCIIFGFGGMRFHNNRLSFEPSIPQNWNRYKFKIQIRGSLLDVEVNKNEVVYNLIRGEKLEFYHKTRKVSLSNKEKISIMHKIGS